MAIKHNNHTHVAAAGRGALKGSFKLKIRYIYTYGALCHIYLVCICAIVKIILSLYELLLFISQYTSSGISIKKIRSLIFKTFFRITTPKRQEKKNNKPAEKHFNKPKNVPDTEPYCVFCTRASMSVYRCCLTPAALVFD